MIILKKFYIFFFCVEIKNIYKIMEDKDKKKIKSEYVLYMIPSVIFIILFHNTYKKYKKKIINIMPKDLVPVEEPFQPKLGITSLEDERYKFYTNNLFIKGLHYNFKIPGSWKKHRQNEPVYYKPGEDTSNPWGHGIERDIHEVDGYHNPNMNKGIVVVEDDGYYNYNVGAFVKTREIKDKNCYQILGHIQFARHWAYLRDPIKRYHSIKWENKKNEIIWRGAPTVGGWKSELYQDRKYFCSLYHKKYNVGFNTIWDRKSEDYKILLKDSLNIDKQLEYKYIISIEGNEKDSGLNWKLRSNSLVIMRPPLFESWLMESKLEPWIHYVPLKNDFTNLDEIYNWCLNNDNKCQDIVRNANTFMDQFQNIEDEEKLFSRIVKDYNKYISFTFIKENEFENLSENMRVEISQNK
jgi:hypothetical protein